MSDRRVDQPDVPALVAEYRDCSQRLLRAEQLPGRRQQDLAYKMFQRLLDIELQLGVAGERILGAELALERWVSGRIIKAMTGQPLETVIPHREIDDDIQTLQETRARIAARLAEHKTVTP